MLQTSLSHVSNKILMRLGFVLFVAMVAVSPVVGQQALVAPEKNPPGDIPDDQVFGKPVSVEHERFLFFKDGKTVTLDFAAPAGADNIDQWKLMSNAFKWN